MWLPLHLHLAALRSGRWGDTPPVGRQDSLLKANGWVGRGTPSKGLTDAESAASTAQETGWKLGLERIMTLYLLEGSEPVDMCTVSG